jgi:hypothetical protein
MKIKVLSLLLFLGFLAISVQAIPFTLHNNTLKSIPLSIPGVMNPNLSPMSNSGVDLAVGQKVYFFVKKKKILLLEVTKDLEGKTLSVGDLIMKRKKELGLPF